MKRIVLGAPALPVVAGRAPGRATPGVNPIRTPGICYDKRLSSVARSLTIA
jgi:hypothetical protein